MGLYVSVAYRGDWWGEDPITETIHETPGELFRSLSGRDKSRPWESLGRCTGKVYVDGDDGEPRHVGWIFVARNPEPTSRADENVKDTGLREAWVTVHTAPDTVVRTPHYAELGR
jgi:hypothetical protein